MYEHLRPLLFRLEAERAHKVGMLAAIAGQKVASGTIASRFAYASDRLAVEAFGLSFDNPFGVAAGFDKNASLIPFWAGLGCGFAEVGSVTARASRGNPRPRAFRLPEDRALINRMGLNNKGAERVARTLARHQTHPLPVALSIAKTHDPSIEGDAALADFETTFRLCAPHADLVVLNLSCPNTREGKTFEDPNVLDELLRRLAPLRKTLDVPVLLKLSPPPTERLVLDSEVDEIISVAAAHRVAGFVASNTDSGRDGLTTDPDQLEHIGRGGLSGAPLEPKSTALVRYLYRKTEGKLPIIGVGGVFTADDAYRKIRAGATLVQAYTALVYHGPGLFRDLKRGLDALLERDGIDHVAEAIGLDAG